MDDFGHQRDNEAELDRSEIVDKANGFKKINLEVSVSQDVNKETTDRDTKSRCIRRKNIQQNLKVGREYLGIELSLKHNKIRVNSAIIQTKRYQNLCII